MQSLKKELFIHIGLPKTGTSAVQYFFSNNFEILKEKYNIYYPDFGRWVDGSHHKIAFALTENVYEKKKTSEEQIIYLAKLQKKIESCGCSRVLISSECFELYNNKNFIDQISSNYDVKIICYLRRQDQYLESCYAQIVKDLVRQEQRSFQEYFGTTKNHLYYSNHLKMWQKITNKNNFIVRVYDKDIFKNGNIVEDFLNIFDISLDSDGFNVAKKNINESINVKATLYKALINRVLKGQNYNIISALHNYSRNDRDANINMFLSLEDRLNLLNRYSDDNNKIIKEYNINRETLFSNEVGDGVEVSELSFEDIYEITKFIYKRYPDIICDIENACNDVKVEKEKSSSVFKLISVLKELPSVVRLK